MNNVLKVLLFVFCFSCLSSTNAQIYEKAEDVCPLLIGDLLPNAELQNIEGKTIKLKDILATQPSVVVFYRGGWCPYCNMQLSGLAQIEKEIFDLGYQIIAISPDDFQNLKNTEENNKIRYKLYSDSNGKLIQDIGIAFTTPTMVKSYIATKGMKGKISEILPVPTVMIVDKEGKILFEYINPKYKERITEEMLLGVLKTIKL